MQTTSVSYPTHNKQKQAIALISGTPHSTIISISRGPGWTGRGLVGSCPCCSKLDQAFSNNLGMFSSLCKELCLLLTSTSWELTWILLSWWLPSEPLKEWSQFFCVEPTMNPANGFQTGGVPTKEISSMGGTGWDRVPVWWVGLFKGSGASEPSGPGIVVVAGISSSCCMVVASVSLM